MKLDALAGNSALKRQLSAQADGRGLSHAYLICGPAGSGKDTLASLLAAAMVCTGGGEKPCGVCPACKKAKAGIHPDIITVDIPEGKREIVVEQTRRMRSDAYVRPNEAPRKVYILRNAQTMNSSAQNSILKLLEEGPPYAAFLLLADNPGALLSTIRSRCELLSLTPAGQEEEGDAAIRGTALQLLDLMARRDETALAAWTIPLERWDREDLTELFAQTVSLLRDALALTPKTARSAPPQVAAAAGRSKQELLRAVAVLEKLRLDCRYNVGSGHLCGALCAGLGAL